MSTRQLLPLIGALFALYIIWGSTYFAIAVGVASWPPLMMAGVRFLSAGAVLLAWLLATGHKLPSRKPLLNASTSPQVLRQSWSRRYRCLPYVLAVFLV